MRSIPIFVVLILMITFSLASPVITLQNKDIRKGETVLSTITVNGEFNKQITNDDITFYQGRKSVFVEHEIFFYNNTHYLAFYPSLLGEVSMKIANILYKEAGQLKSDNLELSFNVSDGKVFSESLNETVMEVLSVRPGVFYSTTQPKINLINKGSTTINVSYNKEVVSLEPMQTQEVIIDAQEVFSYSKFSSSYKDFSIPIIYLSGGNNSYIAPQEPKLKFNPSLVFDNIILGKSSVQILQLFNFADENITHISISSTVDFIEVQKVESLSGKEVANITLKISPGNGGHYSGNIMVNYTQYNQSWTSKVPFSIFVLPRDSNTTQFFSSAETCDALKGNVCPGDCSGNATFTKDGNYCCLGTCVAKVDPFTDKKDSSSTGVIIGVIIILFLGALGYYLYYKSKKASAPKPEEQLKKSSEQFNQRMSGTLQKN